MTTQRTLEGEFDYVIVGAGTAGCVLANRLTEDPDIHVLLLEAGGKDDYHWIHIPVGYLYCIGNPRTDWLYKTQPEAALNGRALSYPRGRVLGGCSSINGMIYMRGQREDYDSWAQETGDAGWSWDSVLPIFKRSEDHHAGASDAHGAGGYWRVEKQRLRWEILESFAQAAQQTGIPATDDFNRGDNAGVGYFEVNQKRGVRWNTSKAFLRPAMARPNLTVITGAQAQRVIFDGRRAVGVEYHGGGTDYVARARSEVLLTSGAVNSPQLLELSGIGDGRRLQALGIDVVQDLPGVGENLQDHLQLRMAFRVEGVRTLNTLSAHWWGKLMIGAEYALLQRGPMSMAPSQLGAFAKSDPDDPALTRPDLEYHVQPLSLERFGEPLLQRVYGVRVPSAADVARQRAYRERRSGRGARDRTELSVDRSRSPRRRERAAAHAPDRVAPALARYRPAEILPGLQYRSEAELIEAAGAVGTTIFHPVGTCRMGRADDERAVVDSRLRVRGVAGLRIVDASVMPFITSGNTNSPTLMIAERASDMIRADRGARSDAGAHGAGGDSRVTER